MSRDEISRLRRTLREAVAERPARVVQADIIRLLLLTGCRRGEIVGLRSAELHGDALNLHDGKTGARWVYLCKEAQRILARQPRNSSAYVFPSPLDPSRPISSNLGLWAKVRRQAGLEDVRLHDLRHTFASQAVLQGVPIPVVARLLGHRNVSMTLRYAHVRDTDVEVAAERIAATIARLLEPGARSSSEALGQPG